MRKQFLKKDINKLFQFRNLDAEAVYKKLEKG